MKGIDILDEDKLVLQTTYNSPCEAILPPNIDQTTSIQLTTIL